MVWDILSYMCCFYLLMNKAALTYARAEYNQSGRDRVGRVKERDAM